MRAVVDVLHEDDAKVRTIANGFGQQSAVHVGMTPWLEHESMAWLAAAEK